MKHIQARLFLTSTCFVLLLATLSPLMVSAKKDYKDYHDQHSYANELVEDIVEVYAYDEDYDKEEAQKMIDHISEIPVYLLQIIASQDVRVLFIDFPITDLEEFTHLKGESPRGHPEESVWDDVPGLGGQVTVVRIGHSDPGKTHGYRNLELHEISHAIEYAVFGQSIYEHDEFLAIHEEEKESLFRFNDYMEYPGEYFAESLSYYFLGGQSVKRLKDKAPKTYEFYEQLPERIIEVVENEETGVSLRWPANDEAKTYQVIRDEEVIQTVEDERFVDRRFDPYSKHVYAVQALDDEEEVIARSLMRKVYTEDNQMTEYEGEANIVAYERKPNQVKIRWEAVDDVAYYELWRDNELIGRVEEEAYTDTELVDDQEYTYEVLAITEQDEVLSLPKKNIRTEKESSWLNNIFIILVLLGILLFMIIVLIIFIMIYRKNKRERRLE